MVAQNPLFKGGWTMKKFRATVLNDIWPEILFFSLVAARLLTVLGTVLGLVISFRTSSAYERYMDGRRMWGSIGINSRNLAQLIWIHVPNNREDKKLPLSELESIIEKKTMVNLVQAFSVAVKHFLRGESGVYYEDLFPLICVLPRYASEGTRGALTPGNMLPLWQASEDDEYPYDPDMHYHVPAEVDVPGRGRGLERNLEKDGGSDFDPKEYKDNFGNRHGSREGSSNGYGTNRNFKPTAHSPLVAPTQLEGVTYAQAHTQNLLEKTSEEFGMGMIPTRPTLQSRSPSSETKVAGAGTGLGYDYAGATGGWSTSLSSYNPRSHHHARRKVFDPEMALPSIAPHRPLRPARDPPDTRITDFFPILRFFVWIGRTLLRKAIPMEEVKRLERVRRKTEEMCQSNVPLEIVLFLSSYTAYLMKHGLIQPAIASSITSSLTALQDTMSQLERIVNTPLPFAYQAHLRMSLWIYLFFLPFQIFPKFGYLTIPGTAFAAFLLVGFLEIGQEIENPFNYDENDLDLDGFCLSMGRELHEITAHTHPEPESFIFTAWNQPFAPSDRRTAWQILHPEVGAAQAGPVSNGASYATEYGAATSTATATGNPTQTPAEYTNTGFLEVRSGLDSVRATLVRNWKQVDSMTRDFSKIKA